MSDLKESLFQAIRVIAQAEDSKLTFTKTIEATIFDNSQAPEGIYQVQYQDGVFPAYTDADNKVTYNIGDAVLVLIPDGDFSKHKRILGKKSQVGGGDSDSASTSTSLDKIDWIGPDWSIWLDYDKTDPFAGKGLIAGGEQESLILFDGFTQEDTTDEIIFKRYFNACHAFLIKVNFRTDFPQDKISTYYGGNYGLRLTFQKNGTEYVFILDTDNMNGDPYNYKDPSTQYIIYKYDNEALAGATITKIELFQEGFTNEPQDHEDIFASNLELSFVQEIEDLDNGYSINILTPQGNVVSAQEITLRPQLKLDGKEISYDTAMWFIEDMSIKVGNEKYSPYAGIGWRNLDVNGTLTIKDSDIFGTTQYKCVVIKGALAFDKTIFIYKLNSLYEFEIVREGPDENDVVTLRVNQLTEMPGPFTYAWAKTDSEGNTFSLSGNSDTYQFNLNEIYLNSTYYCSIYNASSDLVYTARIYIDKTIEENTDINVVFVGNYIFAYDANGDIDYSSYSQPHNLTAEITLQDANDSVLTATWVFPLPDDSMVTIADGTQTRTDEDGNPIVEVGTSVNNPSVDFKIAPKYNINKLNNWIDLRLTTVAGQEYTIRKEIICIKTGNSGTNGTKYYAFLDFQEGHDHVAVNDSAQIAVIEPHVYEDGAAREDFAITYSLGGIRGDDYRFLNINNGNNNSCIVSYIAKAGIEPLNSSNFVTATVTIDDVELHCFIAVPILMSGAWVPLGDTSADNLLGKRYITSVEYNPSGENPSYDKNAIINREYWTALEANDKFEELKSEDVAYEPVAKYKNDGMCGNILATSADCQILWPVVFYLNTYGNEAINGWDGVSIKVDNELGYILSPVVGAGQKTTDTNEFTGVLMGTVGYFDGDGVTEETGLFGFNGEAGRTFFLDAETGDITLGAPNAARLEYNVAGAELRITGGDASGIIINGEKAVIQSEGFAEGDKPYAQEGTQINLADGSIMSMNFAIDENGNAYFRGEVTADSGSIGGWEIDGDRLVGNSEDGSTRIILDASAPSIRGYGSGEDSNWSITPSGIVTNHLEASSGTIGPWNLTEEGLSGNGNVIYSNGGATFGNFSFYSTPGQGSVDEIDPSSGNIVYFGDREGEIGLDAQNKLIWAGWDKSGTYIDEDGYYVSLNGTEGAVYSYNGYYVWDPNGTNPETGQQTGWWAHVISQGGSSGVGGGVDAGNASSPENTRDQPEPWKFLYYSNEIDGLRFADVYFQDGLYIGYTIDNETQVPGFGGSVDCTGNSGGQKTWTFSNISGNDSSVTGQTDSAETYYFYVDNPDNFNDIYYGNLKFQNGLAIKNKPGTSVLSKLKELLANGGGGGVSDEWNALLYLGGSPGSYNLYANHFIFTNGLLSSYEDNGGSVLDGHEATDAVASAVARYL